jgi:hypothetical protein
VYNGTHMEEESAKPVIKVVMCPCCLMPRFRVRLDKKGRPFFGCDDCGAILFPRGGHLGLFNTIETLKLLEGDGVRKAVRDESFAAVDRPGFVDMLLSDASSDAASPLILDVLKENKR